MDELAESDPLFSPEELDDDNTGLENLHGVEVCKSILDYYKKP